MRSCAPSSTAAAGPRSCSIRSAPRAATRSPRRTSNPSSPGLQARAAQDGGRVVGGSTQPAVAGPDLPAAPNGTNAITNPSLEQDGDNDGVPDCFLRDSWGTPT